MQEEHRDMLNTHGIVSHAPSSSAYAMRLPRGDNKDVVLRKSEGAIAHLNPSATLALRVYRVLGAAVSRSGKASRKQTAWKLPWSQRDDRRFPD
jgi:hypothetical protein